MRPTEKYSSNVWIKLQVRGLRHYLDECRQAKTYVSLDMEYGDIYAGFVLEVSKSWALLQLIHGFVEEGYLCIRLKDVVGYCEPSFMQSCMSSEGFDIGSMPPFKLPLNDLKAILAAINQKCRLFFIELDYCEERVRRLGHVSSFGSRTFTFRRMNPQGQWEKDPLRIPYSEVSGVSFGNRYCEIFDKYAER